MRAEFVKHVTGNFWISHSLTMGSSQLAAMTGESASYDFGANYINPEAGFMLRSQLDTKGTVNGSAQWSPSEALLVRASGSASPNPHESRLAMEAEYRGSDFVTTGKFVNRGTVQWTYMQKITDALSMGGEVFYQRQGFHGQQKHLSYMSGGLRYATEQWAFTGFAASFGRAIFTYAHKVDKKVGLATELELDARGDSSVKVGYNFNMDSFQFKGLIEGTGRVSASLENRLSPGFAVTMAGAIDHAQADYKVGLGISLQM